MVLAEASGASEEKWFQGVVDTAPVLIWISGPDKACTYFNQSWLRFTGRSLEQELGYGWADGVHPRDRERIVDQYCNSFDLREPFVLEYRLRGASGKYYHIWDTGVPRFTPAGEFNGYIGACADITARLLAERWQKMQCAVSGIIEDTESLESAAPALLDAISNGLDWDIGVLWHTQSTADSLQPAGVWCRDNAEGPVLQSALRGILSQAGTGLVHRSLNSHKSLWIPDVHKDSELLVSGIPQSASLHAACVCPIKPNGKCIGALEFYSTSVCPLDVETLSVIEALALQIGHFICSRQTSEALREAQAREREHERRLRLLQEREDFVTVLTHDLKGPLFGANLTLQALTDGFWSSLNHEQIEVLQKLQATNETLINLIRDLADVFQYEKRLAAVEFHKVDLVFLIRRVVEGARPKFDAKNIKLLSEAFPETAFVYGDVESLEQCIDNILTNALEFTPEGGITTVWMSEDNSEILVSIIDNGPGIPEDEIDRLFIRPWNGGPGKNYPPQTGLGLYICRRIMDAHEGAISCVSQVGKGSTFTMKFPAI